MNAKKTTSQFDEILRFASQACKNFEADALLFLTERVVDWETVKQVVGKKVKLLVASDDESVIASAKAEELTTVLLSIPEAPVYEKLTQAMLSAVANEQLVPRAEVVAVYSGFEAGVADSFSYIRLDEHLGRLTARDLQNLDTHVPLETLKAVVDLALELGREGREGKPVGTLFVVGDTRKVMAKSQSIGFDPVKGYNRKERNLHDSKVREAIKEVAMLDGAFVVSADGTVEASCRHIQSTSEVTLSKGLGTRHVAAAGITKETKSVAVAVSESSGTVRLFQNGEVLLHLEPFRRPMKWKSLEIASLD
ncbi:MAG: diadenylate cyclase [Planctomycetales bacterium]|nr:diadenylate cyclase [Planctomycetales bacterium]